MSRHAAVVASLGVIAVLAAVLVLLFLERGVLVTVRNSDARSLRSMAVHVTGRSYDLGDLEAGAVRSVRVNPKGESHVELRFRDDSGKARALVVDCYFEAGYGGNIDIAVDSEKVRKAECSAYPN